jgi:hypothetical protein
MKRKSLSYQRSKVVALLKATSFRLAVALGFAPLYVLTSTLLLAYKAAKPSKAV